MPGIPEPVAQALCHFVEEDHTREEKEILSEWCLEEMPGRNRLKKFFREHLISSKRARCLHCRHWFRGKNELVRHLRKSKHSSSKEVLKKRLNFFYQEVGEKVF